MNPASVKRMVLMEGDRSGIRKKSMQLIQEGKINKDDQIQIGNALESLTTHAGWTIIESYIFRQANRVLSEKVDNDTMAETRGLTGLISYINNMIGLKNELLRGENEQK